jgi:hypothetical protein
MTDAQIEAVVRDMNPQDRQIALTLCGNAWTGVKPTPGIWRMNEIGLMHIDGLKTGDGLWRRYKAYPLPLGLAVRARLAKEHDDGQG